MTEAYEKSQFVKPPHGYVRDINIVKNAIELSAHYLHLQTGKPMEQCIEFVKRKTREDGQYPLKPVAMKVLKRNENGDREKALITIDKFIDYAVDNAAIMAPNMVIYDNSATNKSLTADYLEGKLKKRAVMKKKGMLAKQNGDMSTFLTCHNGEYGIKIFINSISGAHANPHNPFYFKVGHSSLTSNTRMIVSYSNASTERFITGTRHYHSLDVIIENILSITKNTDYVQLNALIEKYNLYIPTVDDLLEVIKRSTKFYISRFCLFDLAKESVENFKESRLLQLLNNLSDSQRVIFAYNGDLYHLAKHNDKLVRDLVTTYVTKPVIKDDLYPIEDYETIVKTANGGTSTLVGIMCSDITAGRNIEDVKTENPEDYRRYAETIRHVENTDKYYGDLYTCLFANNNPPSSIYAFPGSIRRAVVGSDTDSTMFTVQWWVQWYFGSLRFDSIGMQVATMICYLNTELIAHWLAYVSRQMGVEDVNLYQLQMKNEFSFSVYARANIAKHYATLIDSREGNVYKEPELELKGVNLKNSKIPKNIMNGLSDEIENTMLGITRNEGVSVYPIMQRIANLEHSIIESLTKGEIKYLSGVNISSAAAYKDAMKSSYIHYDLWVNVFQDKYGIIEPPPYRCIKVKVNLNKPKLLKDWIDGMEPKQTEAFNLWLSNNTREDFEILLLPMSVFENGLPEEIVRIIDVRHIVSELVSGFYIFLSILGFHMNGKDKTILLSDTVAYRPEAGLPGTLTEIELNKME